MRLHLPSVPPRQRVEPRVPRRAPRVGELGEHGVEHTCARRAQYLAPASDVPVDRGGVGPQTLREGAHREPAEADVVEEFERGVDDRVGADCLFGHHAIVLQHVVERVLPPECAGAPRESTSDSGTEPGRPPPNEGTP